MRKLLYSLLALLFCASSLVAQQRPDPATPQGENLEVPEGWEVRLDHSTHDVVIGSDPDSADIYFVNMTPGWHITTGPAGIFYHPANTAENEYSLQTTIHLFDPGDRNREAFGLFLGGKNLKDDNQQYLYFLIRNTGEYLIKTRNGDETELVQDWSESDAIIKYENTEESSVENTLSVEVGAENISFSVNGEEVAEISASDFETDGIYGLRINHSINVHISDLKMTE